MDIFLTLTGIARGVLKKSWRYVILTKLGQHVNEMIVVAVKKIPVFL